MRLNMPREFYIPAGSTKVACKKTGAVAYVYTTKQGKFGAAGFAPKASKPTFHYTFRSEEARAKHVREFFANHVAHVERVAARRAERNQPHKLEVGHVLVASWGYEQTNIDWYQVTKIISPTMVEVRPIAGMIEETGWCVGKCFPAIDQFKGEPMRKKVSRNSISLNSYSSAYLWDGRPRSWSSYH